MARRAQQTQTPKTESPVETPPAPSGEGAVVVGEVVPIKDAVPRQTGGRQPLFNWLGVPIFNPAAAMLCEKVMKDMGEEKIKVNTPEGRLELVQWTDLILRQEQIYGQLSFMLRTFVLNNGNFKRLVARVLGWTGGESGSTAPTEGGPKTAAF